MTRAQAKKQLLGFLINQLMADDEAPFGETVADDTESQEYRAFDGARKELVEEFERRSKGS